MYKEHIIKLKILFLVEDTFYRLSVSFENEPLYAVSLIPI